MATARNLGSHMQMGLEGLCSQDESLDSSATQIKMRPGAGRVRESIFKHRAKQNEQAQGCCTTCMMRLKETTSWRGTEMYRANTGTNLEGAAMTPLAWLFSSGNLRREASGARSVHTTTVTM